MASFTVLKLVTRLEGCNWDVIAHDQIMETSDKMTKIIFLKLFTSHLFEMCCLYSRAGMFWLVDCLLQTKRWETIVVGVGNRNIKSNWVCLRFGILQVWANQMGKINGENHFSYSSISHLSSLRSLPLYYISLSPPPCFPSVFFFASPAGWVVAKCLQNTACHPAIRAPPPCLPANALPGFYLNCQLRLSVFVDLRWGKRPLLQQQTLVCNHVLEWVTVAGFLAESLEGET